MVKSLFWEFSTEEGSHSSVIYGTIHLGTPQCMAHWHQVALLIKRYDHIFTESSLHSDDLRYMQPFILLGDDEKPGDFVTARRWAIMRKTFIKYCDLDIDKYRMFKPLFILAQIQGNLMDAQGKLALDHEIWNLALKEGKKTSGIESSQEQVAILHQLDLSHQYRNLVQISKRISKTRKKLNRLLKAYESQDISLLYKMSKSTLGKDMPALVRNRNHIIAQRLLNFHKEQPSFFSFGAGHLAGGHGVLRLLKQSGASIHPVRIR